MNGIYEANASFDFTKINMISPTVIPGGNYFIKFRMNDIPLYIQTPKCKVKQGFIKSGKKLYCDLMFTRENEEFICWMEKLENYCQKKIYENREKWFETSLDEHDIENSFTSPLKLYKSGKFYITRTNIPSLLGNCSLKIYNEQEELVAHENIKEDMDVITILEIQGIRFSARSFQIDMEIKQMLIMNPVNLFDKCILKKVSNTANTEETNTINVTLVKASEEKPVITGLVDHIETTPIVTPVVTSSVVTSPEITEEEFDKHLDEPNNKDKNDDDDDDIAEEYDQDHDDDEYDDDDDDNYRYNKKIVINHDDDLMEIDLDLDDLQEVMNIKKRDDIYYEMYREAKRKAKMARDLAIASYLEAKNIKNTYMIVDDESDLEEETFHNIS